MALVWKQPHGLLNNYPNLACVASMGAGVDFIFQDPSYNPSVAMTRVVDPMLISDMEEFVSAQIYAYLKGLHHYKTQQQQFLWLQQPYLRKSDVTIGVMGLGVLGAITAKSLEKQGFKVLGWSSTKKNFDRLKTFEAKELDVFLGKVNVLVNLLPLTPQTHGILNHTLFSKLLKGSYIIQVARGPHLVTNDLLNAIDSGQISGAAIDVFDREPLPKNHAFWSHPKVHITPHCASISSPKSVAPQIIDNYIRLIDNQALLNQVDTTKGY